MIKRGKPIHETDRAAIFLHGRGSSAQQILTLASYLQVDQFALLAPDAVGNSWYPYSFLAPEEHNQPHLDRSIGLVDEAVHTCLSNGIEKDKIVLLGFSQGACLALEYAARHADRFGAVIAFTGGLIGAELKTNKYAGNFDGMPVLISGSTQDMHVPLPRMDETADIYQTLGATVHRLHFEDSLHTIREEELTAATKLLRF